MGNSFTRLRSWLLEAEVFIVLALSAAAMLLPSLLVWAVLAGLLFFVLRITLAQDSWRTPADFGILLLIICLPVGLWISPNPAESRVQTLRLLNGLALYGALAAWVRSQARAGWAGLGAGAAAGGLALYALVGVAWSGELGAVGAAFYRLLPARVADAANPNVMAGSLALLAPVPLGLALFGLGKSLRRQEGGSEAHFSRWMVLACGLAGLWAAAVLGVTLSRGGLLALAVALLLLLALRWRYAGWLLPAALAAAAGAAWWYGSQQVLGSLASSATLGGLEGRAEVWQRAVYILQDFPFTGVGLGAYSRAVDFLYPLFRYPPDSISHAHNLFLQIGVDLGLPGLVAWLAVYLLAAWLSWRIYRVGRHTGNWLAAGLGAGLLASQAALGVHGLVDAVTWGLVRPAPLVWAVWGLVMGAARLYLLAEKNNPPQKSAPP